MQDPRELGYLDVRLRWQGFNCRSIRIFNPEKVSHLETAQLRVLRVHQSNGTNNWQPARPGAIR